MKIINFNKKNKAKNKVLLKKYLEYIIGKILYINKIQSFFFVIAWKFLSLMLLNMINQGNES